MSQYLDALPQGLSLKGDYLILEPLSLSHHDELNQAAADGELWNLEVTNVPDIASMYSVIELALELKEQGSQLPFVVRRLSDQRVVGSTRYYRLNNTDRNLSIGYTWYSASVHRTAINTECKLLLLQHAFEVADCISVQWHTHHENFVSQAAIKRLGAKFEGVLRNDKILSDGRIRHTHCFSMLDQEWPTSKKYLIDRLSYYTV